MKFISILYTIVTILIILFLFTIIISFYLFKKRSKNKLEEDEEGMSLIQETYNPIKTSTQHQKNNRQNEQQLVLEEKQHRSEKKEIKQNSAKRKKRTVDNKRIKIIKQLHPGNKDKGENKPLKDSVRKPENKSTSKNESEFFIPDTTKRKKLK